MTTKQEIYTLCIDNNQIKELWPVLLDRSDRRNFVRQLREQGVYAIVASNDPPVYQAGVKRDIAICHMLGHSQSDWIYGELPDVDKRKQMYEEIKDDLCLLLMQTGGIILKFYDGESEVDDEEEEESFEQFTLFTCEFPTQEDADSATKSIHDMWTGFGVDVFDENGKLIEGHDTASSPFNPGIPNAARTNKSPQKRVPCRLVESYGRLCDEKETVMALIASCREAEGEVASEERQFAIMWWFSRRDFLYSTASSAWVQAGLSLDPTTEQLDEWLGGNNLHAVYQS